jgi:hypothetical protein
MSSVAIKGIFTIKGTDVTFAFDYTCQGSHFGASLAFADVQQMDDKNDVSQTYLRILVGAPGANAGQGRYFTINIVDGTFDLRDECCQYMLV